MMNVTRSLRQVKLIKMKNKCDCHQKLHDHCYPGPTTDEPNVRNRFVEFRAGHLDTGKGESNNNK